MLDLLLAADRAANTPQRRDLLDGVMDYNDRAMRRAMEEGEHGAMLADDFFWCFMGLAMAQGDKTCWRLLEEYGYSLLSEVTVPDSDPERKVPLGVWGAAFLPLERLDWLIEQGMLDPFKLSYDRDVPNSTKISAATYAMVLGDAEHFDYWLTKWKAEYHEKRGTPSRSRPHRFFFPEMITILFGMQQWKDNPNPLTPFPKDTLSDQETQRRLDALMAVIQEVEYPKARSGGLLRAFVKAPAFSDYIGNRAPVERIIGWIVAREKAPFSHQEEITLLKTKEWGWLKGALANGAPLDWDGQKVLSKAFREEIKNSEWDRKNSCREALKVFLNRAKQEDPALWEEFFSPAGESPLPFQFLKSSKHYGRTKELLRLGCPPDLPSSDGVSLGTAILKLLRSGPTQEEWCDLRRCWDFHVTPTLREAVWEEERSSVSGLPLDIFLIEHEKWNALDLLVDQGLSFSNSSYGGPSFGFAMLLKQSLTPNRPPQYACHTWNSYRLSGETNPAMPTMFLGKTLEEIKEEFGDKLGPVVRAASLDEKLPSAVPSRGPKPRF